ncbi:hypothetical protein GCM10027059_05110 [Myceligenerans halotolerans]
MGTNRNSAKRAERRLADMSVTPPAYQPPPEAECTPFTTPVDLDDDGRFRLHLAQLVHRNKIVHFSVSIQVREHSLADWQDAFRIDTSHGTVHHHRFWPDGREERQELETIPASGSQQVVQQWFKRATDLCQNSWPMYVKGWFE